MTPQKTKNAILISVVVLCVLGGIGGVTFLVLKLRASTVERRALAELKTQNPVEYHILHTPLGQKGDELRNEMVGKWRLAGLKVRRTGEFVFLPPGSRFFKTFTDTKWAIATYDVSSNLLYSAGGSYTLSGENYTESIDEATGQMKQYLHAHPQFKVRLLGDKFYQIGAGKNPNVVEMWQRVAE